MYRLILGRPDAPITLDATQNIAEMQRASARSSRDADAFARFIADNRAKLALMESILRRPIRGLLDLLDLDTIRVGPRLHPTLSVHDLLSRYFTNEHIRLAVAFQSKYLGMSPYDCPSLFTILPFIEYEFGVWHPDGGCHGLMLALARTARSAGAQIRTATPIEAITFNGRAADGVVADGRREPHDAVVINADATWALKRLIPADARSRLGDWGSDDAVDRRKYSCSTYMLYPASTQRSTSHTTIYTSATYRENLEDITTRRIPADPPSTSATPRARPHPRPRAASARASRPRRQPQGRQRRTPHRLEHAGPRPPRGHARPDRPRHRPGRPAASHPRRARRHPDDWAASNINHGATFNLAHSLDQMLHKRPHNRLRGVERVYLAGGARTPAPVCPPSFPAQIAARAIARDLGIPWRSTRQAHLHHRGPRMGPTPLPHPEAHGDITSSK